MPGTTRYSATFDRPYEEEEDEDLPAVPPLTRRSRSASWQATNGRPYTPLGGNRHARSSSTDNGPQTSSTSTSPAHSTERIPTRTTGKVSVKTSHNPFQFVKVGTCPLYKKAEELLKKTQKVKQPEALKEEEEEWQSNLDSWKSRRRKMSQDVFRRQEEMKELLEMEEQQPEAQQKKVKTFSEMVKEGASRGRTHSLCLFSNPFESDGFGNKDGNKDDSEMSCNDMHQSSESAESSNVNSEDDNDVFQNTQMTERNGLKNVNNTPRTRRTGVVHFLSHHNGVNNGISTITEGSDSNCDFKVSDLELNGETLSHKCEPCQSGAYNDSGLDSLSSSHRAGDIPDSGSDFSQDSGSSLDCDSPGITGIPTSGTELLEEFSSKDVHPSSGMISHKEKVDGMELCLKLTLTDGKSQQYGFTINGGKDKGSPVTVASVINGSVSDLVGLKTGDHILAINKEDISSLSHSAVISSLKQSAECRQLELLLWRPVSSNVKHEKPILNGSTATSTISENLTKKSVTEKNSGKETCNKTNSKAIKGPNVTESSVDNKVDIADSQSSNKKSVLVKQKEVNGKISASVKSQTQEPSGSTLETTKNSTEAKTAAENQYGRSVESENEMFVDDFNTAPVSNNSKIPVAEKSPKIMGKKISKSSQEAKKNKASVSDSGKSDESLRKVKESVVDDLTGSSLNIIYQSQSSVSKVESNAKELVVAVSKRSVPSSADKKVVNESSNLSAQTSTNKQEPKFNERLTFEASEILPVDKVAEQMERLILEQLEEEERLKEKPVPPESGVITTATNVPPEHELSGIDTPPRQVEPPKEKPPPPPTSSSSTNKDSPLHRVNSTKRIKKEIQKRRSDFLGIEKAEEEESTIPPPPDLENILKLECEQERKVRQMLSTESLHQRESSFEEEEIARKEREIIENLETEERIRMEKQIVKDESVLSSSSNDASFAQVEVERIRKLQEERVRMEEERFLKEEQRIRLEEERQLREREEQIRREEAPKTGDLSSVPITCTAHIPIGIPTQFKSSGNDEQKSITVGASTSDVVETNLGSSLKNDPASKNLTTVFNTVASAASSQVHTSDTNKKHTVVKKTKPDNKKSKSDKQNVALKSENKTSIKSLLTEPQSQSVQPSFVQCSLSKSIPSTDEKVVSNLKGSEIRKSSEISQNVGQSNITQSEGTKSDMCVAKQKSKTHEISNSIQQNKQAPSQNGNAKTNDKHVSESKAEVVNVLQHSKQNENAVQQREGIKSISVPHQEPGVLQISQNFEQISEQKGDIKSKMLNSKQKLPASEIPQSSDSYKKYAPCNAIVVSKKCAPKKQPKILETSQNAEVQAVDLSCKTCNVEEKSKDTEASHNVEPCKTTALQNIDSQPKSLPESKVETVQIAQNVGQKQTPLQIEGTYSEICASEQKFQTSEATLGVEQSRISEKQHESIQKLKVLETSQNVEKKQTVPPVESCSTNRETCVSEQNSKTLPASQNVEQNKQTVPQTEALKVYKCVPEQKATANIVRVRKKKKVLPKPVESENSNAGVTFSKPASQNNKFSLLPTADNKLEDKISVSVIPGSQNKENYSSAFGNKTTDVNCISQSCPTITQNEFVKLVDKKNNCNEISHNTSSVVKKNAEGETSSSSKVENASDVSAITPAAPVLTFNSENTASVSFISSSVSNDASLSQTGDGKNKETVCMPSASGDQSSITKESNNNLVPTKPLKKKEVIRKERERLRQEQESLQREREEYRRQMLKEQELLKESQKSHAPDAPVSRVGAPPPLKPALPHPLTSLPHASQALKENAIYTSRSPPTNSGSGAVGNHNAVTSKSPSLLSPPHTTASRPKVAPNDAWGPHKVPVIKKQPDAPSESRYNQNHWLIQEAEMRRISEQKERQRTHPSSDPRCPAATFNQGQYHPMHVAEENCCGAIPSALQKSPLIPGVPSLLSKPPSYPMPTQMHLPEQQWNYGQPIHPTPQTRKFPISNVLSSGTDKIQQPTPFSRNVRVDPSLQAPTKPSRVIPMDRQEQMLSVSGRKRCSHCGEELGRGAAMIIESLQLYYHIQCFRCCVCQAQLGNGSCGTDVRVRNNKLHCHNCYSNDEAGLKFSQV